MADLALFASDPKLETEGVWQEWRGGIRLRIARIWSTRYERVWSDLLKAEADSGGAPLTEERHRELSIVAAARALLVDWAFVDGQIGEDGLPLVVPPKVLPETAEKGSEDEAFSLAAAKAKGRNVGKGPGGEPILVLEFEAPDGQPYRHAPEEGPRTFRRIVPYTPELGERILAMPEYRDLLTFVETLATHAARFRIDLKERTLGN